MTLLLIPNSYYFSLRGSTLPIDNQIELNSAKQERTTKHNPYTNLAQRNPTAFFQEIKSRLLAYQTGNFDFGNQPIDNDDDDPLAILDLQIAQTIDDADNDLSEHMNGHRKQSNNFTRYDSGVATDSSEKNYEVCVSRLIDVIWYPSLDTSNALLSTIAYRHSRLTFKEFRQLFKKQATYRYFFKTICAPDINKEQYVFRELTMDDELVPFYNGKIFVQLDRLC